jgi:CHAD domain-containing protein
MAKPKQIDGLDCNTNAAEMAARVLSVRFDEMFDYHSAALDPDGVDGVHDMRVASRRFRSALRDFAPLFDKKAIKPLKKRVKKVADALGDVRDQDVAIEALEALRQKSPNEAITGGIDLLIGLRRSQRSDAHAEMLDQVTDDRLTDLQKDFDEAVDLSGEENTGAQTFQSFGVQAIERALEKFLERSESIYDPFNDKALHKLRLSAKRLRYALELFNDCWSGELKPFAKYVSKIQSSLGQVHDSSEWITYLGDKIREDNGLDRQTAAWLISEFVSLRTEEYLKALELWKNWLTADFEVNLRSAIENRGPGQ